jgi:hypothetical protein
MARLFSPRGIEWQVNDLIDPVAQAAQAAQVAHVGAARDEAVEVAVVVRVSHGLNPMMMVAEKRRG